MNVAFIYPPQSHKSFEEDMDIVSREFGVFPPLGLAYAAAINEKMGNKSFIIDANAEKLKKEEALARVQEFKPDMLGFMLTAYGFFETLNWIKYFKEKMALPVIAGNILCSLYPEIVLQHKEIDYIIIGPATDSLPALIKSLQDNTKPVDIPGVCYKNHGRIMISAPETIKEDFDRLPFPSRHLLPNEKYHAIMSKRKNYTIMVTSKGCNAKCTFCHIHKIPLSFRKEEAVISEVEECYRKHGIREMDIFDPSFTISRNRVLKICTGIIEKKIDIHWACRARVDQVDEELLDNMYKAGCRRILYGIESGTDENLNKMKKGITVKQAKKAVAMTKGSGIMALGFFMLGVPGETVDTLYRTIKYSRELGLDYAQYHRTMAKPDTELSEQVNTVLGYDFWKEYIKGRVPEKRLPAPWTQVSDDQIQRAAKQAYLGFYFRPRYLLKLLSGIRSWDELKRYMRSAIGLFLSQKDR
ncbi:MAG: radical SAM protein [Candidatus Omnitrophica bacterium]|nr:radical SAM protein [Candidatus Omnitrophota bacterium]